jgi:hypothetical protein
MLDETRYRFEGHFTHPGRTAKGSCYYFMGTMKDLRRWKENNQRKIQRWQEQIKNGETISIKITRQEVNADGRIIGAEEVVFQLPDQSQKK